MDLGGRIRVYIYFRDHNPPHVHVKMAGASAVFNIKTLACIGADGFSERALGRIQAELVSRRDFLMEKWDEYQEE